MSAETSELESVVAGRLERFVATVLESAEVTGMPAAHTDTSDGSSTLDASLK